MRILKTKHVFVYLLLPLLFIIWLQLSLLLKNRKDHGDDETEWFAFQQHGSSEHFYFDYKPIGYFTKLNLKAARSVTRVLILVTSRPGGHDKRAAIRSTWGNSSHLIQQYYNNHNRQSTHDADLSSTVLFQLKFVVGQVSLLEADMRVSYERSLDEEHALYKDLVRGEFEESYYNLSAKTNFILQYANEYNKRKLFCAGKEKTGYVRSGDNVNGDSAIGGTCFSFDFLIKSDDDVFLNIPLLGLVLSKTVSTNAYGGLCQSTNQPKRDETSKFYLSFHQFPHKYFPPYCQGPCYYLSKDLVANLSSITNFYTQLKSISSDFSALSLFEDVLVGYYLFINAAIIQPSADPNHILSSIDDFSNYVHMYYQALASSQPSSPYFSSFNFTFQPVPSVEMFRYLIDSRAMSQGANSYKLPNFNPLSLTFNITRSKLEKFSKRAICRFYFNHSSCILAYHSLSATFFENVKFCISEDLKKNKINT